MTHLEMTGREQLRPGQVVPELALAEVGGSSPLIRPTTLRIAAEYRWPSLCWGNAQWADYLADPGRQFWLIRYGEQIAGLSDFQRQEDGQVEITTFGLVPEFVGKGLGGHALTLAAERAWAYGGDVRRIWLHTSTLDHPHALANYRARGFRPFRVFTRTQEEP